MQNLCLDPEALKAGTVPGVFEGFAVDAWLGNWDVVGKQHDNLMVSRHEQTVQFRVRVNFGFVEG